MDHLFLMTYGRSGSTLCQGLLNALPGVLIRGENRNAVYSLFDFHRTCSSEAATRSPVRTASATSAFFGITGFDETRSLEGIGRLVTDTLLRPEPNTRVVGFKEIRWYMPDLPEYVAFLRQVFPGARFLVNTRDLVAVSGSKWWAEEENALARLTDIEERILKVADALGEDAYRVHYDDYVADPDLLRGMFDWLGEDWHPELVRQIMAVRHSR